MKAEECGSGNGNGDEDDAKVLAVANAVSGAKLVDS